MRKIILIFGILVYCGCISAQQQEDYFSLSLELVKHNDVIDAESYFQATLKNNNEKPYFVAWSRTNPYAGTFLIETELNNGEILKTNEYPFFAHCYTKQILWIQPKSSIVIDFPLSGLNEVPCFFAPTLERTKQYKRIRIKLLKLRYGAKRESRDQMPIIGAVDLITSNWVNLSNEDISKAFK